MKQAHRKILITALFVISILFIVRLSPSTETKKRFCGWPHYSLEELYIDHEKLYDISICIQLQRSQTFSNPDDRCIPSKLLFSSLETSCLTYMALYSLPKSTWETVIVPNIFQLYPQVGNFEAILARIKMGESITDMPVNNPPRKLLRISNHICPLDTVNPMPDKYDVLIIVKSLLSHSKKRQQIRDSLKYQYTDLRVALVFSLGVGNTTLDKNLDLEESQYDDIIQGNYEETNSLRSTAKLITNLRWASAFCKQLTPFILLMEDTSMVNLTYLNNHHIKQYNQNTLREGVFGDLRDAVMVQSDEGVPWPIHPTLVDATFYALGSSLLDDLAIASAFTRDLPDPNQEEIFLGLLLTKLWPTKKLNYLLSGISPYLL